MAKFIKVTTETGAELIMVEDIDSVRFIKEGCKHTFLITFKGFKTSLKVLETIDEIHELLNEK